MSTLPVWARKPNHKKEVVATSRGWMVKETGEMLKLVKNLDDRLKTLKVETEDVVSVVVEAPESDEKEEVMETISQPDETPENASESVEQGVVQEPVVEVQKPKRRGRPKKQQS